MEGTQNNKTNEWNVKWIVQNNNKLSTPLMRQTGKEEFTELVPSIIFQTEYDMIFQLPKGLQARLILQRENGEEVKDGITIQQKQLKDCLLIKIKFNTLTKEKEFFQICFVLLEAFSICKMTSKPFQVKQNLKRSREEDETKQQKVMKVLDSMEKETRFKALSILRRKYQKEDSKKFSRTM